MAELDVAIRASGDDPNRLRDWPVVRHHLRRRFGDPLTDAELWERCTDLLRAECGLDPEVYLRMARSELISLLEKADPSSQRDEKVSPSPTASCFVFMRCWPGFTDNFPYGDFDTVPDDAALTAVRRALAIRLWENREEIKLKRRADYVRWVEALKKQSRQVRSFGPKPLPRRVETVRQAWRRTHLGYGESRDLRFARQARQVGWHKSWVGPLHCSHESLLFTPRIWLVETEAEELAATMVAELGRVLPSNDAEAQHWQLLNPRFGMVAVDGLTKGEQAACRAAVSRLWSQADRSDWAELAWSYLPCIDSLVVEWNRMVSEADCRQQLGAANDLTEGEKRQTVSAGAENEGEKSHGLEANADTGFYGGAELRRKLQIDPNQECAFDKALERARRNLGDANWQEVANPMPNQPRFLYRVSAASELATKYRAAR